MDPRACEVLFAELIEDALPSVGRCGMRFGSRPGDRAPGRYRCRNRRACPRCSFLALIPSLLRIRGRLLDLAGSHGEFPFFALIFSFPPELRDRISWLPGAAKDYERARKAIRSTIAGYWPEDQVGGILAFENRGDPFTGQRRPHFHALVPAIAFRAGRVVFLCQPDAEELSERFRRGLARGFQMPIPAAKVLVERRAFSDVVDDRHTAGLLRYVVRHPIQKITHGLVQMADGGLSWTRKGLAIHVSREDLLASVEECRAMRRHFHRFTAFGFLHGCRPRPNSAQTAGVARRPRVESPRATDRIRKSRDDRTDARTQTDPRDLELMQFLAAQFEAIQRPFLDLPSEEMAQLVFHESLKYPHFREGARRVLASVPDDSLARGMRATVDRFERLYGGTGQYAPEESLES